VRRLQKRLAPGGIHNTEQCPLCEQFDPLIEASDLDSEPAPEPTFHVSCGWPARDFLAGVSVGTQNELRARFYSGLEPAFASQLVEVELETILQANSLFGLGISILSGLAKHGIAGQPKDCLDDDAG
jgi:hypothetical protein